MPLFTKFSTYLKGSNLPKATNPFDVMSSLVNNPCPIIFDVGAHEGQTAKQFRILFPKSKVFCFEPFSLSFEKLCSLFSDDPAVENYQIALSEKTGVSNLSINQNDMTNSLLVSDPCAQDNWGPNLLDTKEYVYVKTDTISRFCEFKNIERIDILKLDVQGSEYSILEGSKELLKKQKIDLIYMEVIMAPTYTGQHRLAEYLSLFDTFKYELFGIYNLCHNDAYRLIQVDVIMVSSAFLENQKMTQH